MFLLARDYLKSVLNDIGITDVRFRMGSAKGTREARIFSMANRGRITRPKEHSGKDARQGVINYIDPTDKSPSRTIGINKTEVSGNDDYAVVAIGALFITNGVVANDYFIRSSDGKRSKIITVVDEDTLTLEDLEITADNIEFYISPNDGNPIVKSREKKSVQALGLVVQFSNRTIELAEIDFKNFNRKIADAIYDGQYAQYYDERTDANIEDAKGNPINIVLGSYEFLDNKYYGELENAIVQQIEFVGGIYIVPDQSVNQIGVSSEWIAPESEIV